MTIDDLLRSETDRIEWKLSDRDSNDIFHSVCALANDLGNTKSPGYLLLGVNKRGIVEGISPESLDDVQQRTTSRLTSVKILPTPTFDVEVHEQEGRKIVLVRVHPYPVPPIVKVNGTVWVRQGSVTRHAVEADILRLQERRPEKNQPFDLRTFPGGTLDDLNTVYLKRLYDAARDSVEDTESFPSLKKWLEQLQLGRGADTEWRPNPAALLIYGTSPQSHFPCAVIEFVRYSGEDIDSQVITRKTITGTLTDQLELAWTQLKANNAAVPVDSEGIRTSYRDAYPLEALKELVRNLVQHRLYEGTNAPGRIEWYSNHLEFSNPGGPFGRASEGDFGTHADYRNPIITTRLVEEGYVERLGRGIRRVRKLLEKNGNPPLEVETDGFTRLTIRSSE